MGSISNLISMLASSPAPAEAAVQTPGVVAEGLPWGDVAVVLAIVFIVMAGLALSGWLERR